MKGNDRVGEGWREGIEKVTDERRFGRRKEI